MVKIKDVLEKMTEYQVIEILKELGSNDYKWCNKDMEHESINFQTVCHGGDSHKLYYYIKSKRFHCYTQCGDSFDIFELIKRVRNISFYESLIYVANKIGMEIHSHSVGFESNEKELEEWKLFDKYDLYEERYLQAENFEQVLEDKLQVYNRNVLQFFDGIYYNGWLKEGITIDTMKKYHIKYNISANHIVIPHFNQNDELIGIRRRTLQQKELDKGIKYSPIYIGDKSYAHPLSYNLYGLNNNKGAIEKTGKVIIFESEKSVMMSESVYGENNFAVAVCGSSISRHHRRLLLNLKVSEVFIAFDKEVTKKDIEENTPKYVAFKSKMKKLASLFTNYADCYIVYDKEDILNISDAPIDKGKEILERLMKNKEKVLD